MKYPSKDKWSSDQLPPVDCLIEGMPRLRRKKLTPRYDVEHRFPKHLCELLVSDVRWVFDVSTFTARKLSEQAGVMARLEEAANKDERTFINTLQAIKWEGRRPEEFVRAIKLALRVGAPTAAQYIYSEGVRFYADSPAIQKYARLFAPPRAQTKTLPPNPTLKANREWLKSHRSEYRGQWVAVRNGELLAAAVSLEELIGQVGDTANVLLTRA